MKLKVDLKRQRIDFYKYGNFQKLKDNLINDFEINIFDIDDAEIKLNTPYFQEIKFKSDICQKYILL